MFLVAAGVVVMVLARGEGRDFHLPGGDGTVVMIAGAWAGLLIFYRVFDRPAGNGYPVGIEWGFFLAFVAAGSLAYAGWRMRAGERPEPPRTRARAGERAREPDTPRREPEVRATFREPPPDQELTPAVPAPTRPRRATPAPARREPSARPEASSPAPAARRSASGRPRYPPSPSEQMSFEDPPPRPE